jgi:hypothetical protein
LSSGGGGDIADQVKPRAAADNLGNIVVTYESEDATAPPDIFATYSADNGVTWKTPQRVSPAMESDAGSDSNPVIATNGRGNWSLVWDTENVLNGLNGTDGDIAVSNVYFPGEVNVEGRLFDRDSGQGIVCAALEFVWNEDPAIRRVVTTDQNGFYSVNGIPPGDYDVNLFPVGYPDDRRGVRVIAGEVTEFNIGFHASDDGDIAIIGVVTDILTGELLAGTRVMARRLDGKELITFTCADGRYQFFLDDIFDTKTAKQNLAIALTFDAEGYLQGVNGADVPPTGGEVVNQAMNRVAGPSTLAGIVASDGTGSGLSGVFVTLSGGVNISTQSQGNGAYLFDALPAGTYSLRASKTGYATVTVAVPVPDTTVTTQNVSMVNEGIVITVLGDINGDGSVNAVDVQSVINGVLGTAPTVDTDVNDDGQDNAIDVQLVINAALGL